MDKALSATLACPSHWAAGLPHTRGEKGVTQLAEGVRTPGQDPCPDATPAGPRHHRPRGTQCDDGPPSSARERSPHPFHSNQSKGISKKEKNCVFRPLNLRVRSHSRHMKLVPRYLKYPKGSSFVRKGKNTSARTQVSTNSPGKCKVSASVWRGAPSSAHRSRAPTGPHPRASGQDPSEQGQPRELHVLREQECMRVSTPQPSPPIKPPALCDT